MWNTVAILAQVARISPSLPRLLTIVRSRGARCSDLSKPKISSSPLSLKGVVLAW